MGRGGRAQRSAGVGTAAAADVEVPYNQPRYSQPQPPPPDYYPEENYRQPPRNYGFREVPPPNYGYREPPPPNYAYRAPPPAYGYEEEEVLPPAYAYPPRPAYRYYERPVVRSCRRSPIRISGIVDTIHID